MFTIDVSEADIVYMGVCRPVRPGWANFLFGHSAGQVLTSDFRFGTDCTFDLGFMKRQAAKGYRLSPEVSWDILMKVQPLLGRKDGEICCLTGGPFLINEGRLEEGEGEEWEWTRYGVFIDLDPRLIRKMSPRWQ